MDDDIARGTPDAYILGGPYQTAARSAFFGIGCVPATEQYSAPWTVLRVCDDGTLFCVWHRLSGRYSCWLPAHCEMEREFLDSAIEPCAREVVWRKRSQRGVELTEYPI